MAANTHTSNTHTSNTHTHTSNTHIKHTHTHTYLVWKCPFSLSFFALNTHPQHTLNTLSTHTLLKHGGVFCFCSFSFSFLFLRLFPFLLSSIFLLFVLSLLAFFLFSFCFCGWLFFSLLFFLCTEPRFAFFVLFFSFSFFSSFCFLWLGLVFSRLAESLLVLVQKVSIWREREIVDSNQSLRGTRPGDFHSQKTAPLVKTCRILHVFNTAKAKSHHPTCAAQNFNRHPKIVAVCNPVIRTTVAPHDTTEQTIGACEGHFPDWATPTRWRLLLLLLLLFLLLLLLGWCCRRL